MSSDNQLIKNLYEEPLCPTCTDENAYKYVFLRLFSDNVEGELAHELYLTEENRKDSLFSTNLPNSEKAPDHYSVDDWLGVLGCLKQVPESNLEAIVDIDQFKLSKNAATMSGVDMSPFESLFGGSKFKEDLSHLCVLLTSKLPLQSENSVAFWPENSRCESDLRSYNQNMEEDEMGLRKEILYHILKN